VHEDTWSITTLARFDFSHFNGDSLDQWTINLRMFR